MQFEGQHLSTIAPFGGCIGAETYEAALTNGDGACGLHSLFGVARGGELVIRNARARVHAMLPDTWAEALTFVDAAGRDVLVKVVTELLNDIMATARDVARHVQPAAQRRHPW